MLLNIALMGMQAFHNYNPTFIMHADPLVTLPTICNHYTHSWLLPTMCSIPTYFANFNLQIFPFSYYHKLITTLLWH